MTQEVELRTLLAPSGRKALPAQLRRMGFVRKESYSIKDAYYCPRSARSFKEVEMNAVGSFSLRLRASSKSGVSPGTQPHAQSGAKSGAKAAKLNLKIITQKGDHHSWQEHEILIDSFPEAEAILLAIGFKRFFALEKVRTVYKKRNISLCVEDIKDFQPCLELEILTIKKEAAGAKQTLLKQLANLGIPKSAILQKSITNVLMRKRARF